MESLPHHRRVDIRPLDCLQRGAERLRGSYWSFVGVGALVLIGMQVPLGLCLGPLLVGAHLCFLDQERFHGIRVGRMFDGFEVFLQAWIVILLQIGLMLAIVLPLYLLLVAAAFIAASQDMHPSAMVVIAGGFMLVALPLVAAVYVPFSFAPHLMAERGLSGLDAVKASARAARANFGGMFALWLLMLVLCNAAAMFCVLPVFLVFPVCLAALVEAHRKVFGEAPPAAPPSSAPPTAA